MQRQTDARDGIMSSNAQKYSRMGDVLANKWMRADNVFRAMDKYDSPEVLSPVFGGLTGSNLDPWFCSSYCGDEMMVTENEREYLVTLAIPGCDRKNVSVNIREHKGGRSFLEIAWHYKKKFGSSNENVLWMGRSWSSGQRNFPIPSSCDKSRINADMKNGSLVITMPKSERPCKNYSLARNKPINFC
jgi:HSP20 family molecular chaperone IbpA